MGRKKYFFGLCRLVEIGYVFVQRQIAGRGVETTAKGGVEREKMLFHCTAVRFQAVSVEVNGAVTRDNFCFGKTNFRDVAVGDAGYVARYEAFFFGNELNIQLRRTVIGVDTQITHFGNE